MGTASNRLGALGAGFSITMNGGNVTVSDFLSLATVLSAEIPPLALGISTINTGWQAYVF